MDELMSKLLELHTDWDEGKREDTLPSPDLATEEAVFVGTEYHAGDEVSDENGNVYIATQDSYYISSADAEDAEDGFDTQVSVGWHTPALLKSDAAQVIVEQIQGARASIVRRSGVTFVKFIDEVKPVPLSDLAYSKDIGLYQKSKYPHENN